jgi:hypothetical protein
MQAHPDPAHHAARGLRPRARASCCPTNCPMPKWRGSTPLGRSTTCVRTAAGPAGAAVGPHRARHRAQPGHDDRARHQQLPRRRQGNAWTVIDPGPAEPGPLAGAAGARWRSAGALERILVTHTHRDHSPGARRWRRPPARRCWGRLARTRTGRTSPLRARAREPAHGERCCWARLHAARDPHAGPCVQPPVLPAGRREAAVHRRPRDAGLHGGHQPARRRHGAYLARCRPAGRRPGVAGAGPWFPGGRAARRAARA